MVKKEQKPIFDAIWAYWSENSQMKGARGNRQTENLRMRLLERSRNVGSQKLNEKIDIDYVEFFVFPEQSLVVITHDKQTARITLPRADDYRKIAPLVKNILQVVKFKELRIRTSPTLDFSKEFVNFTVDADIDTFEISRASEPDHVFWLNLLRAKVVKISALELPELSFLTLIEIPNIIHAPFWQATSVKRNDCPIQIAKIWIKTDAKCFSTFQLSAFIEGTYEKFYKEFLPRLVSRTDTLVRITTDNPNKHIVLELGADDGLFFEDVRELQFFRLIVIPANYTDNDYDWNRQGWVSLLDPEYCVEQMEHYEGITDDSSEFEEDQSEDKPKKKEEEKKEEEESSEDESHFLVD